MTIRIGSSAPDFTAETTEGTIRFQKVISMLPEEAVPGQRTQGFNTIKPYLRTVQQPR